MPFPAMQTDHVQLTSTEMTMVRFNLSAFVELTTPNHLILADILGGGGNSHILRMGPAYPPGPSWTFSVAKLDDGGGGGVLVPGQIEPVASRHRTSRLGR